MTLGDAAKSARGGGEYLGRLDVGSSCLFFVLLTVRYIYFKCMLVKVLVMSIAKSNSAKARRGFFGIHYFYFSERYTRDIGEPRA